MPNGHLLRVYLRYRSLFVSDLRFTLQQIEKAYNALQARERNRRRVPLADRLVVDGIATGQSIELLIGGGIGLLALMKAAERVFNARKAIWESEKAKWDAKTARLDYEERIESAAGADQRRLNKLPPDLQAEELLRGLVDTLAQRGDVRGIELEVDRRILRLGSTERDRQNE
jgi:hypothetical protein